MFGIFFKKEFYFFRIFIFLFVFCYSFVNKVDVVFAGNQVQFVKTTIEEILTIVENKSLSDKGKKQKLIDKYIPIINFEWNAKMAMGRPYLTLSKEEQKEYINEYRKFLAYIWLPKIEFPERSLNVKINVEDNTIKHNDKDESVIITIITPDAKKYSINLRVRDDGEKCQILNIEMEGINIVNLYNAQFSEYIEKNNGKANSIIEFLKQQNKINEKKVNFIVK